MTQYPLFVPPGDLASRQPPEWRASEADRYREWLLAALPGRTEALRGFLSLDITEDSAAEILAAGRKATMLLRGPEFSVESAGDWKLTSRGYALAADLGLLIARRLVEGHPDRLRWETVRRPKRDASYHLPVLVGFSTPMRLEPIGGSIAEAYAVLRGTRGPDTWEQVFTVWSASAEA